MTVDKLRISPCFANKKDRPPSCSLLSDFHDNCSSRCSSDAVPNIRRDNLTTSTTTPSSPGGLPGLSRESEAILYSTGTIWGLYSLIPS